MSTVEKIEEKVREFSAKELAEFSQWFETYLADKWDQQMERDARAGKLDKLAEEALSDFRAGRCKPFP